MAETPLKYIGTKLKQLREQRGLRQIDVATEVAINYRHYQNIESGKIDLRLTTLFKCLEFLEVTVQEFFKDLGGK